MKCANRLPASCRCQRQVLLHIFAGSGMHAQDGIAVSLLFFLCEEKASLAPSTPLFNSASSWHRQFLPTVFETHLVHFRTSTLEKKSHPSHRSQHKPCSSTLRVEHSGLYPTPLSSPFFRRSCRVLKTPSSFKNPPSYRAAQRLKKTTYYWPNSTIECVLHLPFLLPPPLRR